MAPRRKSGAAAATAAASEDVIDGPGIEELYLPKSLLTRVAKSALPEGTSLAKEIPTALQNGSTVFISYVTMLAHDIATERKQKTITATHVLEAVKQLGWDDQPEVSRRLKKELAAFRKIAEAKKNGTTPAGPTPRGAFGRKPAEATATSASDVAMSESNGTAPGALGLAGPSGVVESASDKPEPARVGAGEDVDARMTVLEDGRPNADEDDLLGEDDEEVYEGGEEDEEDAVEDEEDDEGADQQDEGEQDNVGDGLEDDEQLPDETDEKAS